MEGFIFNIINILFEVAKLLLVATYFFKEEITHKKKLYICSLLIITGLLAVMFISEDKPDTLFMRITLEIFVSCILLNAKIINRIYKILLSYAMVNIFDSVIYIIISNIILENSIDFNDSILKKILIEVITTSFYIICIVVISIIRKKSVKMKNEILSIGVLITNIMCCVLVTGGLGVVLDMGVNKKIRVLVTVAICLLCTMLLILSFAQYKLLNSRNYYKEILENKEKYDGMRYQYYELQQKSLGEMQRFRHDINKHLSCIYSLNKDDKNNQISTYIEQLTDSLCVVKNNYIDCGNEIVSAIVNTLNEKCEEKKISLNISGHIPETIKMNEMDMCTVMGNLTENAFEACEKVTQNPFIDIVFAISDNNIVIKVSNSTTCEKTEKNSSIRTSKTSGMHGIGLKNIINTLEKNGGTIEWEVKNYIYTAIIYMNTR